MQTPFRMKTGTLLILIVMACACSKKENEWRQYRFTSREDSLSYYKGVYTAWKLRENGYQNFEYDAFLEEYSYSNSTNQFDTTQYKSAIDTINHVLNEGVRLYFEKNKIRKGVITTSSGLQYEILKKGNSILRPEIGDTLILSYVGKRIDGLTFDNRRSTDIDTTIFTGNLSGLKEGISIMTKGSKYRFAIPPKLSYGVVKEGSTLMYDYMPALFEVEIFDIIKKKE